VRLGKSSNALTNGTSDLAHGLSISSRKRFCSTSLSRSFGSISQPLVLSALDSEASEAASWSSVVSILVGCEVGQVLGRTLGARRWCACACLERERACGRRAVVQAYRAGRRVPVGCLSHTDSLEGRK
jgi:hypothetical protein